MGILHSGVSQDKLNFPVRFFIALAVGAFCWMEPFCLPEKSVTAIMMVLAQGHFLLSYWYQYKAGKMNQSYAWRYIPFAVLLFGACFVAPVEKLFEAITAAYFVVHFFYDERYLLREEADFSGWKITLPTIGILAAEVIYRYAAIRPAWLFFVAFGISAAYMSGIILRAIFNRQGFSRRSAYFLLIFSVAALLTLSGKVFSGPVNLNAINFIILIHFGNWYWSYLAKFSTNRSLLRKIFIEAIAVNAVMGGLMVLLIHSSLSVFLSAIAGVFFLHPYFHVWSLLHYVATYRHTDIMNWVPARNGNMAHEHGSSAQR